MDNTTRRCVACAEGCLTCDATGPGRCDADSCEVGWGLVGSACVRCSANCTSCASEAKCLACDAGYGLWQQGCRSCGSGCEACTFDKQGRPQCSSCQTGGLDAATKACIPCQQVHCGGW